MINYSTNQKILVVMDMEGTITQGNSVRELNKLTGTSEINDAMFEKYLQGKISTQKYSEFLKTCYDIKDPLDKKEVERAMSNFLVFEGFKEFIDQLDKTYNGNLILALASSGVKERVEVLAERYGFHEQCYSTLNYQNNKLIGISHFLFPKDKENFILYLIKKYSPKFVIVIGDSEWDKPMMKHADLIVSVGNEEIGAHKTIYSYYELAEYLANNGHKGIVELTFNGKNY